MARTPIHNDTLRGRLVDIGRARFGVLFTVVSEFQDEGDKAPRERTFAVTVPFKEIEGFDRECRQTYSDGRRPKIIPILIEGFRNQKPSYHRATADETLAWGKDKKSMPNYRVEENGDHRVYDADQFYAVCRRPSLGTLDQTEGVKRGEVLPTGKPDAPTGDTPAWP